MIELQYIQSLPWFCKSNFTYDEIASTRWNIQDVPSSSSQIFIRSVDLEDTYTGMFLLLPRASQAGETRSVAMSTKSSEACIYVTTNANDAVRLTSFDLEWFPGEETDTYVGHRTLLAKPNKLGNTLFGSVFSASGDSSPTDQCVVFPDSGPFYIQSIYLDNNSGYTKIIFIFKKFKESTDKTLGGFSFYGTH